jgi:hypothetical protein
LRLLLDEHFSPAIADQLRRRGHDVLAVAAVRELRHLEDAEALTWAVAKHRAVVTEDAADYLALHRLRLSRGEHHYGILFTNARRFPRSRRGIGKLVRVLDNLLRNLPADEALRADVRWL